MISFKSFRHSKHVHTYVQMVLTFREIYIAKNFKIEPYIYEVRVGNRLMFYGSQ